jgi:RecA/RadA recombinase
LLLNIEPITGELLRTGKSYLCHALCVECLRSVGKDGANVKALYIDAEGSFDPGHITQHGLDLNCIGYVRVQDSRKLMKVMVAVLAMSIDNSTHSLLVVDSASTLYPNDHEGNLKLEEFLQQLNLTVERYGIFTVITHRILVDNESVDDIITKASNTIHSVY